MPEHAKTNTLKIRTPEGIEFSLHLAGPLTRFLAWSLDLAAIGVISKVLSLLLGILGMISRDLASAALLLAMFLVSMGYGIIMEWRWRGQTLGKRLLRLRVMDAQGLHLRFNQVVMRNLLRVVDGLPAFYLVGGLIGLVSRRAQRLGDIAANTIVVRHPEIAEPDLDQLLGDKYNSFLDFPHLAARLRRRVSPREAWIALQALLRRDLLDPGARVALFDKVALHFKARTAFPREATDGLSSEQYLRNVVDVLYRQRAAGSRKLT